jgi:hypothetical protein
MAYNQAKQGHPNKGNPKSTIFLRRQIRVDSRNDEPGRQIFFPMNRIREASPVWDSPYLISRHDFMLQHRLTIGKHCKEIFICQTPGDGPI